MFVSAMKARKWLASGCTRYLASVVDTTKKEKDELRDVLVVNKLQEYFLKIYQAYLLTKK